MLLRARLCRPGKRCTSHDPARAHCTRGGECLTVDLMRMVAIVLVLAACGEVRQARRWPENRKRRDEQMILIEAKLADLERRPAAAEAKLESPPARPAAVPAPNEVQPGPAAVPSPEP